MATKRAVYELAEFKADGDTPGQFKAEVSVFGNVDLQGDRVMPGAFAGSLDEWRKSGDPIPVIWSHDWQDPHAHIGSVDPKYAVETATGLQVVGKLDIQSNPFAAQVHKLLVERRVKGMSFAYEVRDERTAKDGANELTELGIIEVGPTLKGANPDAQLISAKAELEAAAAKAGRRLSQATRTRLAAMRDELDGLLAEDAADEPKHDPADANGGADTEVDVEDREPPAKSDHDDTEKQSDDDREPPAKSTDDELLLIKTRIEQVRAETRRTQQ